MTVLTYPAILKQMETGIRITFPDLPEASMMCGANEDIYSLAQECLWVALFYRAESHIEIPNPSQLETWHYPVEIEAREIMQDYKNMSFVHSIT